MNWGPPEGARQQSLTGLLEDAWSLQSSLHTRVQSGVQREDVEDSRIQSARLNDKRGGSAFYSLSLLDFLFLVTYLFLIGLQQKRTLKRGKEVDEQTKLNENNWIQKQSAIS